jgi:hypothetical protein
LTVAFNRAGKPHFGFLLETYINEWIHQFKFKFEDGSVAT